jgi:hypothetical protein
MSDNSRTRKSSQQAIFFLLWMVSDLGASLPGSGFAPAIRELTVIVGLAFLGLEPDLELILFGLIRRGCEGGGSEGGGDACVLIFVFPKWFRRGLFGLRTECL